MIKCADIYGIVRNWADFEYRPRPDMDLAPLRAGEVDRVAYARARSLLVRTCSEIWAWYPSQNGVLTIERKQEPLRGVRWNIGSGLHRGYTLEESVRRAAIKEAGLEMEENLFMLSPPMMGFWERSPIESHPDMIGMPKGIQDFSVVLFGRAKSDSEVRLDDTSKEYHILTEGEFLRDSKSFHPYLQEVLPVVFDIGTGRVVIPEVGKRIRPPKKSRR